MQVRRYLGRDPATGAARWSAPFAVPERYLATHATLAYATTAHAALGRTVSTAHVLVDGLGDRQGLYVALSRGRDANFAYCITQYPALADVREGSRPDPELGRLRRLTREHAGVLDNGPPEGEEPVPTVDPVSVLAGVMARDGGNPLPMGDRHRGDPPGRDRCRHRTAPPPPRSPAGTIASPPRRSSTPGTFSPDPADKAEAPGVQPTLDRKTHLARHADHQPRSGAVSARHQDANGQLMLGLTTRIAFDQIPEQVLRIRDNAKAAQAKLDDLAATQPPRSAEARAPLSRARNPLLQPPQPDVVPSARVLQHHRAARAGTGRAGPERE